MKYIYTLALCLLCPFFLSAQDIAAISKQKVKPGIEVLRDSGFEGLKGKRVGLVTNPSGVDSHLNPLL